MEAFTSWQAIAAPIDERNLDTNQLCPTRFNKVPLIDPDYQRILFHNQRFDDDGNELSGFILNTPPYRETGILVADENFGCGSSRESAVYALLAFGIRSVIAPSFGDIFSNNSLKNGLVPVRLPREVCDDLRAQLHADIGALISVDLERLQVTAPNGTEHAFDVHPEARRCLLEGLDDIALTLQHRPAIESFEAGYKPGMPWIYPQA
ncbi:MAG: 3-isopropylmalate/(R)-2-methylmalate dehydratase small subunit [Gammaproteobacteria bacterium]|jgi:3-isopropylmalate/(R)-2-methylmalate dehydratase small subunit